MSDNSTGIGISGVCLLWGIITQFLSFAGVIQWPWYAIWGPILVVLCIVILEIIIIGLIEIIKFNKSRR